ncbi:sulfotransferase family protein [Methylotuvimicrobium buryatense]|uniref:Sulfotransferase n=1 Tax=Methylotuvimicrobium buryatense TaxID=95641 RepID=A0A4P9UL57_METBY|nr:sulfotransferase [Methylotuvimicrobium buryatense]QCW81989.1 sulfotransferase [Methylotuvimicrobium buryatense]
MPTSKIFKLLDPLIIKKNLHVLSYKALENIYYLIQPDLPDPIFLVGCSRAGTTVTFETIRASKDLLSFPYEIPQFWHSLHGPWNQNWSSEAAFEHDAHPGHRQKACAYFYSRLGKGQVVDKSCINVMRIAYLHRLFPNAYFIYIQRDGRDNISSLMEGWKQRGRFNLQQYLGKLPETVSINDGEFDDWCFFLPPGWRDYNHAPLEEACAYQWITANKMALEAMPLIADDKWIHLRYEDIFEAPVEMFQSVFDRLQIPFTDDLKNHCATLNKRPTSIVNGPPKKEKWKSQNPEAIEKILPNIESLMIQLGYPL